MKAEAQRIAELIEDYRQGEIPRPTSDHVMQWVGQFDRTVQKLILSEMAHILEKTYVSQRRMGEFLAGVAQNEKLTEGDPKGFWARTELLEIQQRGASQRDMVKMLRSQLTELRTKARGAGQDDTSSFVYLDDSIFTGGHLLRDVSAWIKDSAPAKATVYVVSAFIYTGASYRAQVAKGNLEDVARAAGKQITFQFWRIAELENRIRYSYSSDVLRLKAPPDNEIVQAYIAGLQPEFEQAKAKYKKDFKLNWRTGDEVGAYGVFTSGANRALFEEQHLIAGAEARLRCPHFIQSVRPLGYEYLTSLGFGGTVVTYRNCPNNCPLAWWAGDPWYPLFPRRTNTETAIETLTVS